MIKTIHFQSHQTQKLAELNQLVKDGFTVLSTSVLTDGELQHHEFILYKADDAPAVATNVQWDAITSIEGAETYSKSQSQHFHFWRCELASGQRVNVFDHPDESRNTYKIAQVAGWDDVFPDLDILEEFETPIPCQVSSDGEWLSLASIMPYEMYQEYFFNESSDMPDWAKEDGEK